MGGERAYTAGAMALQEQCDPTSGAIHLKHLPAAQASQQGGGANDG